MRAVLVRLQTVRAITLLVGLAVFTARAQASDLWDGIGAAQRGDYATALAKLAPLAEAGDREAQYKVGLMYLNGLGVALDHAKAFELFTAAANQGQVAAVNSLGYMHENGIGRGVDLAAAARHYRQAAEAGMRQPSADSAQSRKRP